MSLSPARVPLWDPPRARRRGAAAIEFALWLPVLMLFLSAAVDWGHYMSQRVRVGRAVMDGARSGAAHFESSLVTEGDEIRIAALNRTTLMMGDMGITCPGIDCVMTVSYCNIGAGGACNSPPFDGVVVEVTYQYTPFFGMIPMPPSIYEKFIMSAEQQRP